MDDRKRKVLLAIIQDYILTAEPVGSRTISRKYDIGVSPATIRNEMADLEEMGYIEQPHTSAGRVPSDKGYRYYVDFLMERLRLSAEEEAFIYQYYDRKISELEEVIKITSELISKLTSYAAITLGPLAGCSKIKLIDITSIDEDRALLVVVTDTGLVEHRFVEVPGYISPQDLETVSTVLRKKLRGLTLNQVTKTLFDEIFLELRMHRSFLYDIFDTIDQALQDDDSCNVYLNGALNILKHPEFKSIEKVRSLLSLLQQKELLRDLMTQQLSEGLTVRIGGENIYEGIHDCSLITATYSVGNQVVGTVGLLGPTRMEYSKAISVVECITEVLSEVISKYYS